jgi:hypothetical protein
MKFFLLFWFLICNSECYVLYECASKNNMLVYLLLRNLMKLFLPTKSEYIFSNLVIKIEK